MADSLIDLIRQKKTQIAQLQKELDEALGELTREGQGLALTVPRKPHKVTVGEGTRHNGRTISPTSSIGLTIEVLRQAGKPLRIQEILKRLDAGGHKTGKNTLVGGLSRYVKQKRVFYRPHPSTFGLLEQRRQ
jgi:hypothetical protein